MQEKTASYDCLEMHTIYYHVYKFKYEMRLSPIDGDS